MPHGVYSSAWRCGIIHTKSSIGRPSARSSGSVATLAEMTHALVITSSCCSRGSVL